MLAYVRERWRGSPSAPAEWRELTQTIDAPEGTVRNGTPIILHRKWRGVYAFSTDTAGAVTTCTPSGGGGCKDFPWPARAPWTYWYDPHVKDTHLWYGALPLDQADETGLSYRRNRYYDGLSGQFTQQDPIGIAGGLNLYGYAAGDPINFSDPFGLCVDRDKAEEDDRCWDTVALLRQVAEAAGERGTPFAEAADNLAAWTGGKVLWQASSEEPLNGVTGLAPWARRAGGNMYIAIDQKAGDFILTAIHEVLHLPPPLGLGQSIGHREPFRAACRAAVAALPSYLSAPAHRTLRTAQNCSAPR